MAIRTQNQVEVHHFACISAVFTAFQAIAAPGIARADYYAY
jgi:hypothetical protein